MSCVTGFPREARLGASGSFPAEPETCAIVGGCPNRVTPQARKRILVRLRLLAATLMIYRDRKTRRAIRRLLPAASIALFRLSSNKAFCA